MFFGNGTCSMAIEHVLQRVECLRRGSDFIISGDDFDLFSRFSSNSDGSGGLGGVF